MKNILLLMILILTSGALAYFSKNNSANDETTKSIRLPYISLKPLNNNSKYNQKTKNNEENNQNITDDNKINEAGIFQLNPLTPPVATINKANESTTTAVYSSLTQENKKTEQPEKKQNFQNWQEAVESQGFDLNNAQDIKNLKKIRLEFFTLQEIKEKESTQGLVQYIEDAKDQLRQNNSITINDNILLGDFWEITYKNNLEENSPLFLKKFIESFLIIPLKKEIEIENSMQNDTKNKSAYNSFFSAILNNSFFAPIGSDIESHTPNYNELPAQGIDCGGGTEVPEYPPGSSFYASSCDSCSKYSKSCKKLCGACGSSTGYLWDSITGICGCGQ